MKAIAVCVVLAATAGFAFDTAAGDKTQLRSAELKSGAAPLRLRVAFENTGSASMRATASLRQSPGGFRLELRVEQGPPGTYGVILHEGGSCGVQDPSALGGHWNPKGAAHGRWSAEVHHEGDVGNLEIGPDGTGSLVLFTDRWSLGEPAETDVMGKTLVIHARPDDYSTQPDGNVGAPLACAVIAPQ